MFIIKKSIQATGSGRSAKAVEALIEMAAEDQARIREKLDDATEKDIHGWVGVAKKHLL